MKIGILGSGVVGQTVGKSLAQSGHDVVLGTRSPDKLDEKRGYGESLQNWLAEAGSHARVSSFQEAASHGDVIVNATAGTGSVEALRLGGSENIGDKLLIDIANPLDFSKGMPPTLTVCNSDSLGERIQKEFPRARVVKTLNTVTARVMVSPTAVAGGGHDMFICGEDADARARVTEYLKDWFGWTSIVDLGGISAARGMEMYLPLWLLLWGALGTPMFNVRIVR